MKQVRLTEQQIDDLLSCIFCTKEQYEKETKNTNLMAENNPSFMKSLESLSKKLWKVLRGVK